MDQVYVYRRQDRKWAWRRVTPNGQVIATDGGQGYENQGECEEMAHRVNGIDCVYVVEKDES